MTKTTSSTLLREHCRMQAALGAVIVLSMLLASVLDVADSTSRLLMAGLGCALLTGGTLPYGLGEPGLEPTRWKHSLLYAGVLFLTGTLGLPTIAIVQQFGV